jgi:hypothetical protein
MGSAISMNEKRNAYRVLVGKTEGKRPLGRSRHSHDMLYIYIRILRPRKMSQCSSPSLKSPSSCYAFSSSVLPYIPPQLSSVHTVGYCGLVDIGHSGKPRDPSFTEYMGHKENPRREICKLVYTPRAVALKTKALRTAAIMVVASSFSC